MTNRLLLIWCLLISFLFSLLFFFGHIDPDFFDYLTVGRGIVSGQDMYRDFAENKGPITYLFFAFLFFLFQYHYDWGLISASTIIDGVAVYVLLHLMLLWMKKNFSLSVPKALVITVALMAFYKSFSIGAIVGGLYSEQIAMLFLLLSLWQGERSRFFLSGLFFSLAFLSRQSALAFLLLPLLCVWEDTQHRRKNLIVFLVGLGLPLFAFMGYFWIRGTLSSFFYGFLWYSVQYSGATNVFRKYTFTVVPQRELRILCSLIFIGCSIIYSRAYNHGKKISMRWHALLIGSFVATFSNGLFHYHHFLQCVPLVCLGVVIWYKEKRIHWLPSTLIAIMLVSVCLGYIQYVQVSYFDGWLLSYHQPHISEIEKKRYLQVYPFYPRLYIDYRKLPPDRYYIPFFLEKEYNAKSADDRALHMKIPRDILCDTTFAFISVGKADTIRIATYLGYFREKFSLKKRSTYTEKQATIDIYTSDLCAN